MKKEVKGGSEARGTIFGATPRALAADELDRVFGGQAGPPNSPPPTTPTTPGSGPYPYPYKRVRSYDLYGQEN